MRNEENAANKSHAVNVDNGSEYYSLQTTIKSTAVSTRKEDDENATKLRRSMENVEASAGLRSEGRLNMVSPNQPTTVATAVDIDSDFPLIPEEFRLPKNSGPYAPIRVRAIPLTPSVGIASREFFNRSAPDGGLKRKRCDGEESRTTSGGSRTGPTYYDRNGTFHRPEPGNRNRDLISKIDDGNDIISSNIGRLQTILDRRTERTSLATTGQVLSNVGAFISSVHPNVRLLQRAEDIGDQLLDQIINEAGLSNLKNDKCYIRTLIPYNHINDSSYLITI